MSQLPAGFDALIAPLSRDQFLAEYWGRNFLYQSGTPGRFTPLFPWDALNGLLNNHSPLHPQVRLFQDGKMVDVHRYVSGSGTRLKLNEGGLIAALSSGASLIVDGVQDSSAPIRTLLQNLEDVLDGTTTSNVYAGWRASQAFDLHWDPHEVIVLQLSGRKAWKVYGPTRPHPLGDDVEKGAPASGPPVFDGVLNDGDLLYIPRGWWHMAVPLDEPSLHLSIGIEPPTGQDFLYWMVRRLLRHADVRQNMPADGAKYFERLSQLFAQEAASNPVTRFLAQGRAARRVAPNIHLPFGPLDQKKPASAATAFRLAGMDHLFIEAPAGERMAKFTYGGQDYHFATELVPVFRKLSGRRAVSLSDLSAGISHPQALAMLAAALEMLADAGILLKE